MVVRSKDHYDSEMRRSQRESSSRTLRPDSRDSSLVALHQDDSRPPHPSQSSRSRSRTPRPDRPSSPSPVPSEDNPRHSREFRSSRGTGEYIGRRNTEERNKRSSREERSSRDSREDLPMRASSRLSGLDSVMEDLASLAGPENTWSSESTPRRASPEPYATTAPAAEVSDSSRSSSPLPRLLPHHFQRRSPSESSSLLAQEAPVKRHDIDRRLTEILHSG